MAEGDARMHWDVSYCPVKVSSGQFSYGYGSLGECSGILDVASLVLKTVSGVYIAVSCGNSLLSFSVSPFVSSVLSCLSVFGCVCFFLLHPALLPFQLSNLKSFVFFPVDTCLVLFLGGEKV